MLSWNHFSTICLSNTNSMVRYLTMITELKYQLASIGAKVEDQEFVSNSWNGISLFWKPFVQCVCDKDTLKSFQDLGLLLYRNHYVKIWHTLVVLTLYNLHPSVSLSFEHVYHLFFISLTLVH